MLDVDNEKGRDAEGVIDDEPESELDTVLDRDADVVSVGVAVGVTDDVKVAVPEGECVGDEAALAVAEPDAVVDAVSVDVVETDGVVVCERLTLNV